MMVKDVMSKHLIVCEKDNIYEAAKLMQKYDIGFLPIVCDKKLIGVVTDRDIVVKFISNHDENFNVSSDIKCIDSNSSLKDVCELMKRNKVKRLLVTNDKKVIGVISLSDIVSHVDNNTFINTFKTIYEIDRNEHDYDVQIDEFYL